MTNAMPDEIYDWIGMQENGSWDKEPCNCGNHPEQAEYHHSRIVEALRRENEELQAKVNALEMSKIAADTIIDCQKIVMDREQAKLDNVKWQPIETAPKDGTHILAWNYESRFYLPPYICWFGQDMNEPDENKREWLTRDGDGWSTGYYYTPCKPTHWMPLPDAPEQR